MYVITLSDLFIGDFPLTQRFGARPWVYIRFGMKGHNGIDFATPKGTKLLAPCDCEVIRVESDFKGYGLNVRLKFKKDPKDISFWEIIFAHMDSVDSKIKAGAKLKRGQLLGFSNNTGFSSGNHLHFGMRFWSNPHTVMNYNNGFKGWVNPLLFIKWDIKNITKPVV